VLLAGVGLLGGLTLLRLDAAVRARQAARSRASATPRGTPVAEASSAVVAGATPTAPAPSATVTPTSVMASSARAVPAPATPARAAPTGARGRLAYLQAGDLWTRDLASGELHRYTTSGQVVRIVGRSGDGQWLAWVERQQLGLAPWGQPEHVQSLPLPAAETSSIAPSYLPPRYAWSPGKTATLAYLPAGNQGLWLAEIQAERWTSQRLDAQAQQFAWAPSQAQLAYGDPTSIWLRAPDGSRRQLLANDGLAWRGLHLVWSQDGRQLAAVTTRSPAPVTGTPTVDPGIGASDVLTLLSPAGGPPRQRYVQLGSALLPISFSPDGSELFFWLDVQYSGSILADSAPLYRIAVAGTAAPQQLTLMLANPDYFRWSPDGQALAVVEGGDRFAFDGKTLHRRAADGSRDRLLAGDATTSALAPTWSPDSRRLAYLVMPSSNGWNPTDLALARGSFAWQVWTINADGTAARRVDAPTGATDQWVRWTPDGNHLLVVRRLAGSVRPVTPVPQISTGLAQLWLLAADGSTPQLLSPDLAGAPGRFPESFGYYGQVSYADTVMLLPGP